MVSIADVLVSQPTGEQAVAMPVVQPPDESGSRILLMREATMGRTSAFLAAAGDAILGDVTFDDESAPGISS